MSEESADPRRANDPVTYDDLKVGCLQRIADATELMARRHSELIADVEHYKRRWENEKARVEMWKRSNAALRGVITKLKK